MTRAKLLLGCALLTMALNAEAQILYDGIILGRSGKYDGYPTHRYSAGTHTMWWCSQGTYDEVWRATKAGSLGPGGWTAPQKVFGTGQSLWSVRHTCDPAVIGGSFSFEGKHYSLALFYTGWADQDGNNAIGVAFSNDGLNWKSHAQPVVVRYGTTPGYGVGMSGLTYDPVSGKLLHAYLDSTLSPYLRLNQSNDGIHWTPVPGLATQLMAAGRFQDGQGPDIAYNPVDGHWYATIKNTDPAGIYDGETRVLRSAHPDVLGSWEVIGIFNSSVTGWQQNQNPGLGKNGDGNLFIDAQGWAYVFFTVGNPRPEHSTWEVAQGRFRPSPPSLDFHTVAPCRVVDTRSGSPFSASQPTQFFQITGTCGIPATARAVSINMTAVEAGAEVQFSLFPGDLTQSGGRLLSVRPNTGSRSVAAVLRLAGNGGGTLGVTSHFSSAGNVHLVLDVSGYFE
jgi:hypothetical protein